MSHRDLCRRAGAAFARHRRSRRLRGCCRPEATDICSAPTIRAATSSPACSRLAADAASRRARRHHRSAHRPSGRHGLRLCRRLGRCGADADHRYLPRLPEAGAGARLRRRHGAGHRERHPRHRHHLLAALCPHRPCRNADRAQFRLHRRRPADGRLAVPHRRCATSCRCACPR